MWSIGLFVGTALGAAAAYWKRAIGGPTRVVSFILASIPILVLLLWLHYPAQVALNLVVDPFVTAVTALSLVNVFAVAEVIRSAIIDFPIQYSDAAKVCGLSTSRTLFSIQIPITARRIIPALLGIQVGMLQASLFASLISVDEIFRICQRINSEVYRPVEIYTALALLFLAVCAPLHALAYWLKFRFSRKLVET